MTHPISHARARLLASFRSLLLPAAVLTSLCFAATTPADAQSSDRWQRWLEEMDDNRDGKITEDEAGGRSWRRLQDRAERYGAKVGDSIRIKEFLEKREKARRDDNDDRQSNSNEPEKASGFVKAEAPKAKPFDGTPVVVTSDQAEANAAGSPERRKALDSARSLLDKYDRNKNRRLERDEWRRISGDPEKADSNGDNVITYDELVNRLEYNNRRRASGDNDDNRDDRRRRGGERGRPPERRPPSRQRSSKEVDDRRSYRFTPAHERLPDGLPSWFRDRDLDRDGQVAMHEYSSSWTDRRAEEFAKYDLNGDGVITAAEAVGQR